MTKLTIKAAIQIQKPIEDVFDGIISPEKMSGYFISKSSGKLENGKEVTWQWPEFPEHKSIVNNIKIENQAAK